MMDEKEKGKGLAVLIALKAKKAIGKDKADPDRHEDSARELLDAIQADDAKEFGKLLHEYVLSCMDESDADDGEKDEEEY
jgi:3-deoxy-D-arabino-heptulosonate 7-phosphate (DAHP) synthase